MQSVLLDIAAFDTLGTSRFVSSSLNVRQIQSIIYGIISSHVEYVILNRQLWAVSRYYIFYEEILCAFFMGYLNYYECGYFIILNTFQHEEYWELAIMRLFLFIKSFDDNSSHFYFYFLYI